MTERPAEPARPVHLTVDRTAALCGLTVGPGSDGYTQDPDLTDCLDCEREVIAALLQCCEIIEFRIERGGVEQDEPVPATPAGRAAFVQDGWMDGARSVSVCWPTVSFADDRQRLNALHAAGWQCLEAIRYPGRITETAARLRWTAAGKSG